MVNALIAFICIILLGIGIFVKLVWEDGSEMSFRFIKWFFGIFLIAALIVGGYTYFAS